MQSYVSVLKGVLFTPKSFFQTFKGEASQESIGKGVVFILILSLIGGAIAAVLGLMFPAPVGSRWLALGSVVFYPLASIIGSFISAGIVWVICRILGAKPLYRVVFALMAALAAFMPISALFSRILAVSLLISIWSFVSFVFGTIGTLEVKPARAWTAFGILAVILVGLSFWAMRTSQRLLLDAQNQAQESALPLPAETVPPAAETSQAPNPGPAPQSEAAPQSKK